MPIVSVIIPCYNQGNFIDSAVDSVLLQTVANFEIIIINDGSTDEFTINKLKRYNKPFCKVIHTTNKGLAASRNLGLRNAEGRYIQFLDADDIIKKEKFEIQIKSLEQAPENSLCYCDYFPSEENNTQIEYPKRYLSPAFKSENYLKELIMDWEKKLSIPCHAFLFNRAIFTNNNIFFDETLPNHEDWDCWIRIFRNKPFVFFVNKKLAVYRIRSTAMSYDKKKMKEGFLKAIKKQKELFPPNSYEHSLLRIRYNREKYGYGSINPAISFLAGSVVKGIRITKKSAVMIKNSINLASDEQNTRIHCILFTSVPYNS